MLFLCHGIVLPPIQLRDYIKSHCDICGIFKAAFVTHFVKTNIFRQLENGHFLLLFDATRPAVRHVIEKQKQFIILILADA